MAKFIYIRQPLTHPANIYCQQAYTARPKLMCATSLLDFQIYQENMRSKMDFNAKKSILKMDFMDFLLCCFIGKSEKGLQTSFQKSGLFLLIIRHVSARLLFYRTVCQSPSCPYFPKTVKKENPRTDFSQLKPIIRFHILLLILDLKI